MGEKKVAKGKKVSRARGAREARKRQLGVPGLILALVIVVAGSVLFIGAVSGWFDAPKAVIDTEYRCNGDCKELTEISASEYDEMISAGKSFVVLIDQSGCTTADRLREYAAKWGEQYGVEVLKMMFSEMKETTLSEVVKYYPSVVVVSQGQVLGHLRADSDEDAEMYNNYEAFEGWMRGYLAI